jgi:hypothetical protein
VVSDAIKKYRDVFAFGLLAVAVLYMISGLSLLFKSEEDSFLDFSGRAAQTSYLFMHPLLIISLAAAVALAVGFGSASANARAVVVSALVVGGISMVFGLVSWLASFGYDGSGFGGVITAGKIVAIFLGLAQLLALGLTLFFAIAALQTLPKRVPQAQQWGAPPAYGQHQGWGQPDAGQQWGQPGQQQWGQQAPQQQWGQQAPQQQWGQQAPQQQGWAPPEQQQWGGQHADPQQSWGQPEQQQQWGGQHADPQQTWGQPEQPQGWRQPEPQQGWSQPEQQQSWGQPAGQEAQSWAPSETSEVESTTVSETPGPLLEPEAASTEADDGAAVAEKSEGADADDTDSAEGQQDGWWQRPSS